MELMRSVLLNVLFGSLAFLFVVAMSDLLNPAEKPYETEASVRDDAERLLPERCNTANRIERTIGRRRYV